MGFGGSTYGGGGGYYGTLVWVSVSASGAMAVCRASWDNALGRGSCPAAKAAAMASAKASAHHVTELDLHWVAGASPSAKDGYG